jgi:hypothetical protein
MAANPSRYNGGALDHQATHHDWHISAGPWRSVPVSYNTIRDSIAVLLQKTADRY